MPTVDVACNVYIMLVAIFAAAVCGKKRCLEIPSIKLIIATNYVHTSMLTWFGPD